MRPRVLGLMLLGWLGGTVTWGSETFEERFDADPAGTGWEVIGDRGLFRWDAAEGALAVTWDSSRSNSFHLRRLAAPVTVADDFAFGFRLRLTEHAVGVLPGRPGTFQIALGLVSTADAMDPGFLRGGFPGARNLVEWVWFGGQPDGAIAASLSPVMVPSDGRLPWGYSDTAAELETGLTHGFELAYTATNRSLRLRWTVDGVEQPEPAAVVVPRGFTGFRVDALSIHSYSDAGQDPRYAGSVRAQGWVDDVWWRGPGAPVDRVRLVTVEGGWKLVTRTRPGWRYRVQTSGDLKTWVDATPEVPGVDGDVEWAGFGPGEGHGFHRVEARLP